MPTITQIFETLCDRLGGLKEEVNKIDMDISVLRDRREHLAAGHAQLSFAIDQITPLVTPDFAEVGEADVGLTTQIAPAGTFKNEAARRPVRHLVRDWLDDGRRRNGGTVMEIAQALQIMPRGVEKALAYWSQPSKAVVVERGGRWYSALRAGVDGGKAPVEATEVAQEPSGAIAPLSGRLAGIEEGAASSPHEGGGVDLNEGTIDLALKTDISDAAERIIPTGGQIDGDDLSRLRQCFGSGAGFGLTVDQLFSRGIAQEAIDDAIDAGILTYRQTGGDWLYELVAPAHKDVARAAE